MKAGWYSRGYLPHRDEVGLIQFVTIRLADSLPAHVVEELRAFGDTPAEKQECRRRTERHLDAGHGACALGPSEIASMVEGAMLHRHPGVWHLYAWTIRPNHAHFLVRFADTQRMADTLKVFKGWTSHEANRLLGAKGTFWFREHHDRFMRDGDHFANTRAHIDANPVKAGLCLRAEDWPFGSARFRQET